MILPTLRQMNVRRKIIDVIAGPKTRRVYRFALVLILLIGGCDACRYANLLRYTPTTGIVIREKKGSRASRYGYMTRCVVQYKVGTVTHEGSPQWNPHDYKAGEVIPIRIHPGEPDVFVDGKLGGLLAEWIIAVVILIGLVVFYWMIRVTEIIFEPFKQRPGTPDHPEPTQPPTA